MKGRHLTVAAVQHRLTIIGLCRTTCVTSRARGIGPSAADPLFHASWLLRCIFVTIAEFVLQTNKNGSMAYFAFLKNVLAILSRVTDYMQALILLPIAAADSLVYPNCHMPAFDR